MQCNSAPVPGQSLITVCMIGHAIIASCYELIEPAFLQCPHAHAAGCPRRGGAKRLLARLGEPPGMLPMQGLAQMVVWQCAVFLRV